ncbi:protein phosphatase 2C domain-containing protein [Pseudanabaena minima]|uniref:protein phosphatase 2C domain-containing protein n=1 Tax=Pseudanabaena minima TaxID=890415 RepID=UPI003DA9F64C
MTLNLLIKLAIAIATVYRPFCPNNFSGLHSPHGYANFGFKAISLNAQKYSDRSLYNQPLKPEQKNLDRELEANFELIQSFSVQKAGNMIAECEDIWHCVKRNPMVSIALSDGATESSFAREWARELVTTFVNRQLPWQEVYACTANWLSPLQKSWQQWLAHQDLSWFAKRKASEGAFATFVSLEVFADLSWKSIAVGDSCLFIVRDRCLQTSFPLQKSHEFNNRPKLIGTNVKAANINISQIYGDAKHGDRFYLTTDAIACWIFKQLEANQDPWVKLDEISSQDLFAEWVTDLRDRHEIANDDTTLLCLKIQDAPMSQSCES